MSAKSLPATDPNVKIPAAILASAARADQAYNSVYNPEPAEGPEGQSQENEPAAPETPAPETPPVTAQGNEPPLAAAPKGDDEQSWEHRYKSMKGRYDRAEQQLRTMSDQIASLQNVIATMQVEQPAAQSAPAEMRAERLITPEEEADYGSEFLSVVGKRAKEELLPIVSQYEQKIAQLEAKLAGVGGYVQQDARQRMESTLREQVADIDNINRNPHFLAWLKLPDPYSGAIRHSLLKEAYDRNDAARVVAFFKGFLSEEAALDPAPSAGPDQTQMAAPPPGKVPLEAFAAPGRAKTAAAANAPAEKPIFTRAQIAKFYAESAAGKFRGREAEKDRTEQQIFEAEREGRIR